MQEFIQSLQEKVGLTADQAKEAAGHFVDYIKSKLPPALHDHIDSAVSGGSSASSGLLQGGGEMLEKAKEKVEGFVSGIADKLKI